MRVLLLRMQRGWRDNQGGLASNPDEVHFDWPARWRGVVRSTISTGTRNGYPASPAVACAAADCNGGELES